MHEKMNTSITHTLLNTPSFSKTYQKLTREFFKDDKILGFIKLQVSVITVILQIDGLRREQFDAKNVLEMRA